MKSFTAQYRQRIDGQLCDENVVFHATSLTAAKKQAKANAGDRHLVQVFPN